MFVTWGNYNLVVMEKIILLNVLYLLQFLLNFNTILISNTHFWADYKYILESPNSGYIQAFTNHGHSHEQLVLLRRRVMIQQTTLTTPSRTTLTVMTFCQRFSFRSLVIYNLDSKEQKFPKNTKMCMMMFIYLFFFKILNLNCETISSNIVIIYLLTKLRILKKKSYSLY